MVYARIPDSEWLLATILPYSDTGFLRTAFKMILVLTALALGFSAYAGSTGLLAGEASRRAVDPGAVAPGAVAPEKTNEPRIPEPRPALPAWFDRLAPRERRILILLASGKSNKEIAAELDLREQTIKNYISGIYAAIGVQDRVSATLLVEHAGLSSERKNPL